MDIKKMKIFCVPHVGGTSVYYKKWGEKIDKKISVIPFEYKGTGKRKEEYYHEFYDAVSDLYEYITIQSNDLPYAIFGHSMGGLLAYAVAREIEKRGDRAPVHLFISGRPGPEYILPNKYSCLSEPELIEYLIALNDEVKPILENPRVGKIYLDRIRKDYRLLESYKGQEVLSQINIPISIFYGADDPLTTNRIDNWGGYSRQQTSFYKFNGGHFFLEENQEEMGQIISRILLSLGKEREDGEV